ncbi:HEAT repeat domain-containing protein [Actinocrispum wychmicini]|uniref:HEAT repeat protein n=1 Tax=Actinocrispum wychmicini TaxID=1213861 RepID=A0A4R2IPF6_9PSEU|nr:HEAT repeat domain-containing protein [Actinocrispum wychmicini]TCO45868.1 HEAT repeat protein [Actinocrispum wychmicini]
MAAHPSNAVRAIAVSALAAVSTHQPIMVNALSDADPRVVAAAVRGLTAQTTASVFDQLVELLNRTERGWAWVCRAAAQRIAGSSHPRRLDILADALGHVDHGSAHDIARTLARAGDLRVAPVLIELLRAHSPSRCATAFVLGHLRVAEATSALIDALREPNIEQAKIVLEALGKIGSQQATPGIRAMLDHSCATVREAALLALARVGGPLVIPAALAATDDGDPTVRERAIRLLAKHGDHRAVGRLASACDGRHVRIALTGLVRLADASVVPTLVHTLLTTTDRQARKLAGQALAHTGTRTYLPTRHPNPLVRRAVIWVVGQRADPSDAHALITAMQDDDELVRARAAAALGGITDTTTLAKTVAPLTQALTDPKPRVRANAAIALGRTAPAELRDRLAGSLADPHPAVQAATTAALRPPAGNRPQPTEPAPTVVGGSDILDEPPRVPAQPSGSTGLGKELRGNKPS